MVVPKRPESTGAAVPDGSCTGMVRSKPRCVPFWCDSVSRRTTVRGRKEVEKVRYIKDVYKRSRWLVELARHLKQGSRATPRSRNKGREKARSRAGQRRLKRSPSPGALRRRCSFRHTTSGTG